MADPFRTEDPALRVEALRKERDERVKELERLRAETRALRPWSWGRFVLGFLVTVIGGMSILFMFAARG
jgi:hypothetical protein